MLIGTLLTMCTVQKRLVLADPNVAPAFERARADGQGVVSALADYYAAHAYYPKSLGELPDDVDYHQRFNYEVTGMERVYQSMECAGRAKEFTGVTIMVPDYQRRLDQFRAECVRGYSGFALKTRRIQTAWQVNRNVVIYVQFTSLNPRWFVDWCNPPSNQHNTAMLDCSHNPFNEALQPTGTRMAHRASPPVQALPLSQASASP